MRVRPFAHVRTNLAAPVAEEIAAKRAGLPGRRRLHRRGGRAGDGRVGGSDSIYGAEVDGEVEIKVVDFPMSGAAYDESAALEVAEVETRVREAAPFLAEGAVEVASLPYVDPARFDLAGAESGALGALPSRSRRRTSRCSRRPTSSTITASRTRCFWSPRARRCEKC